MLDPGGSLVVRPFFVPALAAIVAEMATADWSELAAQAMSAPLGLAIAADGDKLLEIREAMESQTAVLPTGARRSWEALTARFSPPASHS